MPGDQRRGVFITFEGGEGAGKSTVARLVAQHLRERGLDVVVTQEPEGTALGRHMWEYFRKLAAAGETMTPEAELLLFAAARAEHVRAVISPALARGHTVLCDRFADSTTAYQGYGRGIDLGVVASVNRIATAGCEEPDLTLLLDLSPEEGLRRARKLEGEGRKEEDAMGAESLAFHERVRDGFRALAQEHRGRIVTVDAMQPIEGVAKACIETIDGALSGLHR